MGYPNAYTPTDAERRKDEAWTRWLDSCSINPHTGTIDAGDPVLFEQYEAALGACEPDSYTRAPHGYWKHGRGKQ